MKVTVKSEVDYPDDGSLNEKLCGTIADQVRDKVYQQGLDLMCKHAGHQKLQSIGDDTICGVCRRIL